MSENNEEKSLSIASELDAAMALEHGASASSAPELPLTVGAAAYRRIAKLADAYAERDLLRVNVELNVASFSALGALPKIKSLREELVQRIPSHDMTLFDAFEDIALALAHVDAVVRASVQEKRRLAVQAEALDLVRSQLNEFAESLAAYGLVSKEPLALIKKELGYKALVRDVTTLIELLVQSWAKVGSKAPFTLEQLHQIDREALAFRTAVGLKEQSPEGPREELIQRRRVFTLFRHAVANIREVIIYLRGENAVGQFVPSFANAPGKRSATSDDDLDPVNDAGSASAKQGTSTSAERPSGFTVNNPDNLPITSPFGEKESA